LQEQSLAEQKELQMEELICSWNKLIELLYIILNKEDAWTRKTYQQIIRTVDLCFASTNKTKKKLHIVDDKRRVFLSILPSPTPSSKSLQTIWSHRYLMKKDSLINKWVIARRLWIHTNYWSRNRWTWQDFGVGECYKIWGERDKILRQLAFIKKTNSRCMCMRF
jgi:hypothetical protein